MKERPETRRSCLFELIFAVILAADRMNTKILHIKYSISVKRVKLK